VVLHFTYYLLAQKNESDHQLAQRAGNLSASKGAQCKSTHKFLESSACGVEQNGPYRSYSTAHKEKTLKTLAMVTSTTIKRNAARRPPHHCSAATGNEESSSRVFPLVSFLVLCDVLLLNSVTSNPTTLEPLDESIPQIFFSPGLEFSRGARSLEILSRFAYCTP
jgi:hypothetical protein